MRVVRDSQQSPVGRSTHEERIRCVGENRIRAHLTRAKKHHPPLDAGLAAYLPGHGALQKLGNGLYAAPDGMQADLSDATVRQGYFEQSNTQPVVELTRMIETMRAYESVSKVLSQGEDLSRRAIERLGRV